jgi:hypothetical protein
LAENVGPAATEPIPREAREQLGAKNTSSRGIASDVAPAASEANPREFQEVPDTCMHVRSGALPIKARAPGGAIRNATVEGTVDHRAILNASGRTTVVINVRCRWRLHRTGFSDSLRRRSGRNRRTILPTVGQSFGNESGHLHLLGEGPQKGRASGPALRQRRYPRSN